MDQKACLQVGFVKDPANIDETLDEIVRYQESCHSGQHQRDHSSKAFKAQAACVNLVMRIQIVMKVGNQIELPEPILSLADNPKVLVKLAVQASPTAKRVPK